MKEKFIKKWKKIATVLTVEKVGYACRLLHNSGLFTDIEINDLLARIADSFTTPKSRNISYDSILNKSANPGAKSKEKVKGYFYELARMMR